MSDAYNRLRGNRATSLSDLGLLGNTQSEPLPVPDVQSTDAKEKTPKPAVKAVELPEIPELKSIRLNVEEELMRAMDEGCKQHGHSRETLLEALFLLAKEKGLLEEVHSAAKERNDRRKQFVSLRAALTRQKNAMQALQK
ncbi:MAG: hypothetical protein AB4050_14265 [Synechococcus sp.]